MLQKKIKPRNTSKKIHLDNGVVVTYSRVSKNKINLPEKFKEMDEWIKKLK